MILDAHSDLLWDVTRRRLRGERRVLERCHLEALRRGGVEGLVLAVWTGGGFWRDTPWDGPDRDGERTERMLACAREELAECPSVRPVRTAAEAEQARREGAVYAFLAVEGMASLRGDPAGVDLWADRGARLGMLTWNEQNDFAAGAGAQTGGGLTAAGREAVRRMEARRMLPDVSHLNDRSFWDLLDLARGPVVASHSNCRALCPAARNLTDEQLRAIRDTGGVVGLNAYSGFVSAEPESRTVRTLALHAVHMAEVMGVEHVGCGFDFCGYMGPGEEGAAGLEDASRAGALLRALEELGMNAREREGIARGNFLRVFRRAFG